MRRLAVIVATLTVLLAVGIDVSAADKVEVSSHFDQQPNSQIDVRVKLTNDLSLITVACPLVIRTDSLVDGGGNTRPVSLDLRWRDRLSRPSSVLAEIAVNNTYASWGAPGSCMAGQPGGFSTLCDTDSLSADSCSEQLPIGVFFYRARMFSSALSPGADSEGSLSLLMTLNDVHGCFVIDTTCVNPNNHLLFVRESVSLSIVPAFQMGIVCVLELCEDPFDADKDCVPDSVDNCPDDWNLTQADSDADGTGDACDECPFDPTNDSDGDGICGQVDNCPNAYNPDQADSNGNGIGDRCECECPYQADLDANTLRDDIDLNLLINLLFFNGANLQDAICPIVRADYNGDGLPDNIDLNFMINHLYFNGPGPVDPCDQ